MEAHPLPAGTSAQEAELTALIRALTLRKGKRLNVYSDSKYTFLVLHAHAAIWKERGLLSGRESPIKHGKEILQLLETIHLPKEVDLTLVAQGNNWADQKAKQAALQCLDALPASILALFPPQEPVYPKYTTDEEKEAAQRGGHKEGAWWHLDRKLVWPQTTQWEVVKAILYTTLFGPRCIPGANKQAICGDKNKIYNKTGLQGCSLRLQ
jgi:hypothetical protein